MNFIIFKQKVCSQHIITPNQLSFPLKYSSKSSKKCVYRDTGFVLIEILFNTDYKFFDLWNFFGVKYVAYREIFYCMCL